jgi:hypothetical protein
MFLLRLGLLLAAISGLAGCTPATNATEAPASDVAPVQFRGEIVYLAFEGGFWGIVAEDGRRYQPGGLPGEFRQPGLKVKVTAKPLRDRVTFRMWGTPIELVHIERAEPR